MAIVSFNIVSGVLPVVAQLSGSTVPDQINNTYGVHAFTNVEWGTYTLILTDANGCRFEKEITVNPAVTTTTTTIIPGSSIVIGNTQDPITIFNPDATNRTSGYSGYPDPDIVSLFLWFKTLDGMPLSSDKTLSYTIQGRVSPYISTFEFVELSDQLHAEVFESSLGPTSPLQGTIVLKAGFIETFFNYIYYKNIDSLFTIEVGSVTNNIYPNLSLTTNQGIQELSSNRILMQYYDGSPSTTTTTTTSP